VRWVGRHDPMLSSTTCCPHSRLKDKRVTNEGF
jgi:hypothetical protein